MPNLYHDFSFFPVVVFNLFFFNMRSLALGVLQSLTVRLLETINKWINCLFVCLFVSNHLIFKLQWFFVPQVTNQQVHFLWEPATQCKIKKHRKEQASSPNNCGVFNTEDSKFKPKNSFVFSAFVLILFS